MKAYTVQVMLDGELIVRVPLDGEPEYGAGISGANVADAVWAVVQHVGRGLMPVMPVGDALHGMRGSIATATGLMLTATTDDPASLTEGAR